MKKTMFITSVIMVVVMAIALTTSSLAWFSATSEADVGTNAITISAKSNASDGLYIARGNFSFGVDSVSLPDATAEAYQPVVPYSADTTLNAAKALEALQNYKFVGNTTKTVGGVSKWGGNYSEANTQYYHIEDLYVANSGNRPTTVSASIAFAETHGATLNVAVLARHERNLLDFIKGDKDNNGVINGWIRVYGTDPAYVDYPYVGRVGIKTASVYGEYIDQDGDGQITGEETITTEAFIDGKTEGTGTNQYQRIGESYNDDTDTRTEADYTAATTSNWELLAYKNSKSTNNTVMYLGKYVNSHVYKKQINDNNTPANANDDFEEYVVANGDNLRVDTATEQTLAGYAVIKESDAATYSGAPALIATTDDPAQNNFFEEDSEESIAYGTVTPSADRTSFTLYGTKRTTTAAGDLVEETYGDYMQVRVIAWYSVDLSNSNSGAYDATTNQFGTSNDFTITFTRPNA